MRRDVLQGILSLACLCYVDAVIAQQKPIGLPGNYPTKPVRVIISSAPGGGADFLGRTVFGKLSEQWGTPFHAENLSSGVNGIRAIDATVKAAPDGYTLLVTTSATFLSAAFVSNPAYDIRTATSPIAQFSSSPLLVGVHPGQPYSNIRELVAYAKNRPGEISYGVPGIGSGAHLGGELIGYMTGIKMTVIPYKGAGQAVIDALAGRIPIVIGSTAALVTHVRNGKLKSLGISSANRVPTMPDQHTLNESGLPGYEYTGWFGVVGQAALPSPIVMALNQEINRIINTPETMKALTAAGADPLTGSPQQFRATILSALEKAGTVIKATGIKLEE